MLSTLLKPPHKQFKQTNQSKAVPTASPQTKSNNGETSKDTNLIENNLSTPQQVKHTQNNTRQTNKGTKQTQLPQTTKLNKQTPKPKQTIH